MRRDPFDRAIRVLALTLIAELLWLTWLQADTPAQRPRPVLPSDDVEAMERSEAEPPEPPTGPRVSESHAEDEPTDGLESDNPAIERFARELWEPEEGNELLTMGGGAASPPPDPEEEERRLHPQPPCEIEVVDAEGEPRGCCAVVALGPDDQALELTWTNAAGIARLSSKGTTVDLVIDAGSSIHREPGVRLTCAHHRIAIMGGVTISGRAMLGDRTANPSDGLEVECSRADLPEPFKSAQHTLGVWWLPQDRTTASIDEDGAFRVQGFDVGWTGYLRLVDAAHSRESLCTLSVAAPSRGLVLRGHRIPPPAASPDDNR